MKGEEAPLMKTYMIEVVWQPGIGGSKVLRVRARTVAFALRQALAYIDRPGADARLVGVE